MLSAVVIVEEPAGRTHPFGPLLRTLKSLVPATIEGLVHDLTLLRVGEAPDPTPIADEAGCKVVHAAEFAPGLRQCLTGGHAPSVMVLRAGATPGAAFREDIRSALERSAEPAAWLLLRQDGGRWARILPSLAPIVGVIAPRERLQESDCSNLAEMARRARPAKTFPRRIAAS